MKNDFKNSDKRMQEKLDSFRMPAPEGAWAGIEGAVGGKASGSASFFYLWIILLSIGVGGAGILTFKYFNSDASESNISRQSTSASDVNKDTQSADSKNVDSSLSNRTAKSTALNSKASQHASNDGSIQVHSVSSLMVENPTASHATKARTHSASTSHGRNKNQESATPQHSSRIASTPSKSSNNQQHTPKPSKGRNNLSAAQNNAVHSNTTQKRAQGAKQTETSFRTAKRPARSGIDIQKTQEINTTDLASGNLLINPLAGKPIGTLPISTTGVPEKSTFKNGPHLKMPRGAWSLEAGFDISSFNYTASGTSSSEFLNNSYTQSTGQGAFLRTNYQPIKHLSVHTGIEFVRDQAIQDYTLYNTTEVFEYDTLGFYYDSVTQQTLPILDSAVMHLVVKEQPGQQAISSISQINIPLGVMFHIPLGTRSELGVNLSGILGIRTAGMGTILTDNTGATSDVLTSYRSVNFSARGSIRYSYILNEHISVYAEPYLGFGLNNRSNATLPFVSRFRNSGVRVGLRYRF